MISTLSDATMCDSVTVDTVDQLAEGNNLDSRGMDDCQATQEKVLH